MTSLSVKLRFPPGEEGAVGAGAGERKAVRRTVQVQLGADGSYQQIVKAFGDALEGFVLDHTCDDHKSCSSSGKRKATLVATFAPNATLTTPSSPSATPSLGSVILSAFPSTESPVDREQAQRAAARFERAPVRNDKELMFAVEEFRRLDKQQLQQAKSAASAAVAAAGASHDLTPTLVLEVLPEMDPSLLRLDKVAAPKAFMETGDVRSRIRT